MKTASKIVHFVSGLSDYLLFFLGLVSLQSERRGAIFLAFRIHNEE